MTLDKQELANQFNYELASFGWLTTGKSLRIGTLKAAANRDMLWSVGFLLPVSTPVR